MKRAVRDSSVQPGVPWNKAQQSLKSPCLCGWGVVVRLIYLQGSGDSPGEYLAAESLNHAVWISRANQRASLACVAWSAWIGTQLLRLKCPVKRLNVQTSAKGYLVCYFLCPRVRSSEADRKNRLLKTGQTNKNRKSIKSIMIEGGYRPTGASTK